MRNHLPDSRGDVPVHPAACFVTDFKRLITDVDRLLVDVRNVAGREATRPKRNGSSAAVTLNDTISTLRDHARSFVKSLGQYDPIGQDGARSLAGFLVDLSRADTLKSVAETVGDYCNKAFRSPAGMLFVEHKGDLRLVSEWRSRRVSKRSLREKTIKKGLTHALRAGGPRFWLQTRRCPWSVSRYLRQLLPGGRRRCVAFLPIHSAEQRAVGVLVLVLFHEPKLSPDVREALRRLADIISGCVCRARAYDEAHAARIEAESANQRKDEFLSVLSHELKNPLTPIQGWAVALSSGALPADRQNLAIESIIRNVKALNFLIDDLVDVARISSGKLRLDLAEMRIQEVVREALTAIQQTAENKRLRVSTDISEAIPPFHADSRRVRQVLINILNNAVKFTPSGGSIALKVVKRGYWAECSISDTGKGIESKFLPFVFERFHQEKRSSKTKMTGLGLGLAIVREIIALHGGTIRAYSPGPDQGATFTFRLPIHRHTHLHSHRT